MQIQAKQLTSTLAKSTHSLYLIHGDDPLLKIEARNQLLAHLKKQGFSTRNRFDVAAQFNWHDISAACQENSLFDDKTVLDIHLKQARFDNSFQATIKDVLSNPLPNHVLLLNCPKLTTSQLRSKWLQAIDKKSCVVQIRALFPNERQAWIQQKLAERQLKMTSEAIAHLLELTEGNLTACAQTIEKCQLLYPGKTVDHNMLFEATFDSAQYNVFQLIDTALLGDIAKTQRILQALSQADSEATLVLWSFSKQVRELIQLKQQQLAGSSLDSLVSKHWKSKQYPLKSALMRTELEQLYQLLAEAAQVDRSIKGYDQLDAWLKIQSLFLGLAGNPIYEL